MKLIIDIPNTVYEAIQAVKNIDGSNEGTLENVLIKAVEEGIPISVNATNGEVIDLIFPYEKTIDEVWWNSPYQKVRNKK